MIVEVERDPVVGSGRLLRSIPGDVCAAVLELDHRPAHRFADVHAGLGVAPVVAVGRPAAREGMGVVR